MKWILEFLLNPSWLSMIIIVLLGMSCEEEVIPPPVEHAKEIVVEGYVEKGEGAMPPYVILSYSFPFFSKLSTEDFAKSFINAAEVYVVYSGNRYELEKVCLKDLPVLLREQLARQLGVNPALFESADLCFYIDLMRNIPVEEKGTYYLNAIVGGDTIKAETTIQEPVELDSLYYLPVVGVDSSYREMKASLDPPEGLHYYRYFAKVNQGRFQTASRSVFTDKLFSEEGLDFRLPKPEGADTKPGDPTRFLYEVGDTVTLKWSTIDEAHYDFWRTLEYNRQNQGPFSSYTRVKSNVQGGIGIWGGMRYFIYRSIVE